jgi:hypothetical protein
MAARTQGTKLCGSFEMKTRIWDNKPSYHSTVLIELEGLNPSEAIARLKENGLDYLNVKETPHLSLEIEY